MVIWQSLAAWRSSVRNSCQTRRQDLNYLIVISIVIMLLRAYVMSVKTDCKIFGTVFYT